MSEHIICRKPTSLAVSSDGWFVYIAWNTGFLATGLKLSLTAHQVEISDEPFHHKTGLGGIQLGRTKTLYVYLNLICM